MGVVSRGEGVARLATYFSSISDIKVKSGHLRRERRRTHHQTAPYPRYPGEGDDGSSGQRQENALARLADLLSCKLSVAWTLPPISIFTSLFILCKDEFTYSIGKSFSELHSTSSSGGHSHHVN